MGVPNRILDLKRLEDPQELEGEDEHYRRNHQGKRYSERSPDVAGAADPCGFLQSGVHVAECRRQQHDLDAMPLPIKFAHTMPPTLKMLNGLCSIKGRAVSALLSSPSWGSNRPIHAMVVGSEGTM